MKNLTTSIDRLVNKAQLTFNEAQFILNQLLNQTTDTDNDDSSDGDGVLAIQLTLQYRLCCDDALSALLKIDHNLLYFLGIQPQHSAKMNRDRLAYALGNEDLKQIFNLLALLTESLSKIVARSKKSQTSFVLKHKKSLKNPTLTKELNKLLVKHNRFLELLHQLDSEIEQLMKLQHGEPIFDYIAALRGPISHFHQAIMHSLELSKKFYLQINKTPLINYQINELLKKTEHVLHLMPSVYNSYPNHPVKQLDHAKTSEQLEQRAAAKRLRPFFG